MTTLEIEIGLSDAARTAHAVQTGTLLRGTETLPLDLDLLAPEERAAVLAVTGTATRFPLRFDPAVVSGDSTYTVDAVPAAPQDWIAVLQGFQAWKAERAEAEARKRAERDAERARKAGEIADAQMAELRRLDALDDEELLKARLPPGEIPHLDNTREAVELRVRVDQRMKRARQEREEREEAQREALRSERLEERRRWTAEHGSDHLRKAQGAGYDCQRRYAFERAALEHPDYRLDYRGEADWQERACPGEAALDEALRVGGTVVWLTRGDYDDDGLKGVEAVVIRGYLGRYDLIRTF